MAIVSAQECQSIFLELEGKVRSIGTRKSTVVGDLQEITLEKQKTQQQHGELALIVQQLEVKIMLLQKQGIRTQGILKEPNMKFDGT